MTIAQARRGLVAPGDQGVLAGFWGVIGEVTEILASPEVADALEEMNRKQRGYMEKYLAEQKAERPRRPRADPAWPYRLCRGTMPRHAVFRCREFPASPERFLEREAEVAK